MTKKRTTPWSSLVWGLAGMAAVLGAPQAQAQARAQSAVMDEAGNQRLRDDLQWLADRGVIQLSTSSWPLPLSAIDTAVGARRQTGLTPADAYALAGVERELARMRSALGAGVEFQANTASSPPTTFEAPVRADAEAGAWVQASRGPLAGKLHVQGLFDPISPRQSKVNLEGSYLAANWAGQVLYAGQLSHWWGPGLDGSLIWSNAGLAIPGIGLRRGTELPFTNRWLSWLGPWNYEVFVGKLMHNQLVPGVRVFSLRVQAQPLPRLEVGVSRLIQWGGAAGDNSIGSLVDAFLGRSNDPRGAVNNEIAGFDARYTWLPGGNPLSLYGQLIGEDEANLLPTQYLAQVGLQYKHVWRRTRIQWYLEAADTEAGRLFGLKQGQQRVAYAHSQFLDGMYHEGLPIAHFMGGDGRSISLGVSLAPFPSREQVRYSLRLMRAEVNPTNQAINLAFPASDTVKLAELAASWQMRAFRVPLNVRAGFTTVHTRTNGRDNGVKLGVEVPL